MYLRANYVIIVESPITVGEEIKRMTKSFIILEITIWNNAELQMLIQNASLAFFFRFESVIFQDKFLWCQWHNILRSSIYMPLFWFCFIHLLFFSSSWTSCKIHLDPFSGTKKSNVLPVNICSQHVLHSLVDKIHTCSGYSRALLFHLYLYFIKLNHQVFLFQNLSHRLLKFLATFSLNFVTYSLKSSSKSPVL